MTELARDIHWLDSFLFVIITVIVLFVTALLAIVVVRYNRKSNPNPARFTHNSAIEVTWTLVPILILIVLFLPLPFIFLQALFAVHLADRPRGKPFAGRVPASASSRPALLRGPPR